MLTSQSTSQSVWGVAPLSGRGEAPVVAALPRASEPKPYRYRDLIDEETGGLNYPAYRTMVRSRALREHGAITPKSIRESARFYVLNFIRPMQADWKTRHGVEQPMATITPYGKPRDGVRPSEY